MRLQTIILINRAPVIYIAQKYVQNNLTQCVILRIIKSRKEQNKIYEVINFENLRITKAPKETWMYVCQIRGES